MIRALNISYCSRRLIARFSRDNRGLAAVEFAFIVPLMLVLLFGMIDGSGGVAIKRKLALNVRSVSDIISQGSRATATDIQNVFGLGGAIMTPYSVAPDVMTQKVTQLAVDASKNVKVVWSYSGTISGSNAATVAPGYSPGTTVSTVPANLLVPNTYLIWSEVSYKYTPITGYAFGVAVIPLKDETFTRPRQTDCVLYGTATSCS